MAKYRMFFPGNGMTEKEINWNEFRVNVKRERGIVINYVLPPDGKKITK